MKYLYKYYTGIDADRYTNTGETENRMDIAVKSHQFPWRKLFIRIRVHHQQRRRRRLVESE